MPATCEALDPTAESIAEPVLWFVLAAFPDSVPNRLNTVTFGLGSYDDTNLVMGDWGPCELLGQPLEIPSEGWPGPNTGTAVSWAPTCGSGELIPIYWFLTYAYASGTIPLGDSYPGQSSAFVSCASPPLEDPVSDFGVIGMGTMGSNVCPTSDDGGGEPPAGGEGPGFSGDQSPTDGGSAPLDPLIPGTPVARTRYVNLVRLPNAFSFDLEEPNPQPLSAIQFAEAALRDTLERYDAVSIAYDFPGTQPGDTLSVDLNGNTVPQVDLSDYFTIAFSSRENAALAVASLWNTPGVFYASLVQDTTLPVTTIPNDPMFDIWNGNPPIAQDAQWNLKNDGERTSGACEPSQPFFDNRLDHVFHWYTGWPGVQPLIGIVDGGVKDDHVDLYIDEKQDDHEQVLNKCSNADFCGDHGTKMAGLAAALTNNSEGVAGVCANCRVLDIMSPACDCPICDEIEEQGCIEGVTECDSCASRVGGQWQTQVDAALTLAEAGQLGGDLVVLNLSFKKSSTLSHMATLWNAFNRDIVSVWASGNTANTDSADLGFGGPTTLPWCMGAGGYTWRGLIWEPCDGSDDGTTVGPRNISVCAPASGTAVTTFPWPNPFGEQSAPYYATTGATSGAAAQVSGAVALLQDISRTYSAYGYKYLSGDDVIGLIEATALDFDEDPSLPNGRGCGNCTREHYGRGLLNVWGANLIMDDGYLFLEDVLTEADLTLVMEEFFLGPGGVTYVRMAFEAEVDLGPPLENGFSPDYQGWIQRKKTNTYPFWDDGNPSTNRAQDLGNNLFMVSMGINDAYMHMPDAQGKAKVTASLYARIEGEDRVYRGINNVPLTPLDDVEIWWTRVARASASTQSTDNERVRTLFVPRIPSPVVLPLRLAFNVHENCLVDAALYDVRGRRIMEIDRSPLSTGSHSFTWDGRSESGSIVASGLYFLRIRAGNDEVIRRIFVLR